MHDQFNMPSILANSVMNILATLMLWKSRSQLPQPQELAREIIVAKIPNHRDLHLRMTTPGARLATLMVGGAIVPATPAQSTGIMKSVIMKMKAVIPTTVAAARVRQRRQKTRLHLIVTPAAVAALILRMTQGRQKTTVIPTTVAAVMTRVNQRRLLLLPPRRSPVLQKK
jgi:hypothetical protein